MGYLTSTEKCIHPIFLPCHSQPARCSSAQRFPRVQDSWTMSQAGISASSEGRNLVFLCVSLATLSQKPPSPEHMPSFLIGQTGGNAYPKPVTSKGNAVTTNGTVLELIPELGQEHLPWPRGFMENGRHPYVTDYSASKKGLQISSKCMLCFASPQLPSFLN